MDLSIKVIIYKERNMDLEAIVGLMDQNMRDNGKIIKFRVKEYTLGWMEESMMGIG